MVVALVALLALGPMGVANAQLEEQSPNLIIERLEYGSPRIAGVPAPINVTVRNLGAQTFTGSQGWAIFLGINGEGADACIMPPASTEVSHPTTDDCYIRFPPGTNARSVPGRQSITVSTQVPWNVTDYELADRTNTLFAEILPYGFPPTEGGTCAGPEPPTSSGSAPCGDNTFTVSEVTIQRIGMRVEPVRDTAPNGETENDPWAEDDIRESTLCEPLDANLTRGCYARPGRTYGALYNITNVGTITETFSVEPVFTPSFRDRNYIFDFHPRNITVSPGETKPVQVRITIPENDTAGNRTNVGTSADERLRWYSVRAPQIATDAPEDVVPGCDEEAFDDYCVNPSLPSFITGWRYAFNVTANFTFDEMAQADTTDFLLNITNNANVPDDYNITIDYNTTRAYGYQSIDERWTTQIIRPLPFNDDLPAHQRVAPGDIETFRVRVKSPEAIVNSTYWFDAVVRSMGDENQTLDAPCKENEVRNTTECRIRFAVHVAQDFRIEGIEAGPARLVPAEPKRYDIGIRNSGNGYENITLELAQTVGGWDVQLSNRTIELTPFNTTFFSLTVTSPPNTLPNTEASFYVNATSTGPRERDTSQRSKASIQNRMTIISGPNIRIDAPINSTFVDAGEGVDFTLTVTNVGNVVDSFEVPPPERPSDWGVTVTPDGRFELQPNQQATVTVNLRAPQGAEVGERATALVRVRSVVDQFLEKSIALEGRVSGPDYFIDNVLVNSSNPYSGDPLQITVALGNNGNRPAEDNATLRVYFVQNGVEREIGEKVYPAFSIPGQRRLSETFNWDTTGIDGAGVILARIDVDDNVKEIDESAASNERTRAITLRTFDIHLSPATGKTARPGERVEYTESPHVFVLEYRGNQPAGEPVTIRFTSENGWLSSPAELSLALPRNTPVPVFASLDVPALPGVASDRLTISVIPALRPSETMTASTVTTLLDEEKPIVKAIVAEPASATLGTPVTITAVVEDATGLTSVTAYVTTPTNETSSLVLFKVGADRWSANKTFGVAGRYRVAVEAIDAATPPNRNNTRELTGTFTMTPGSAPVIKLAPGQTTTIRTGSPIKLDIRDPLGIGKASYAIKGVSYELQGPAYQIDTSTLQPGPVEINVTAENIYGVATSARFTFTVDNDEPSITRVTLTPERPRPNDEVTISIQTEPKVETVEVLVKRDGQVVETLNATRNGVGRFSAKFTAGEGDYTVDVTARDAAGNTKLASGAVMFSAKPGAFGVPGAALWMVLVGVVALALAMRRRQR